MNSIWDSNLLKKVINAKSNKSWEATGLQIDSRKVKKGDLFFALKGDKHDGHDYIGEAVKNGASVCLIANKKKDLKDTTYAFVNNVLDALENMAVYARKRSLAKFIGITGSVGKTGTKEMLKTSLSNVSYTFANESSFNNHIGVPLTLSRIPEQAKYCILELGMNRKGEINKLSKLVKPDVAIITAVEKSHLSGLKNLKNIAFAKSEILNYLKKDGCLILNYDTNYSDIITSKAKKLGINNIITYGTSNNVDIRLIKLEKENKLYSVTVNFFGKYLSWKMPSNGEHWIYNSMSALALAKYFQIDLEKILHGLSLFQVPDGRGNKSNLKYKNNIFTIIDDSYNSNPASLTAALNNLNKNKCTGKKILVLGDMLELGKDSLKIHKEFKTTIEEINLGIIFTVGKYMKSLNKSLNKNLKKYHEDDLNEVFLSLKALVKNGDLILIKGSNSMNLKEIVIKMFREFETI